jgi:DNA-binding CsgD family transcriptional regulator
MDHGRETDSLLEDLTDKQKEVLDLLVLHKTSKQIARDLNISPHTVDQRIASARRKFGVDTRGELAAAYMAAQVRDGHAATYEKSVYQSSQVENGDDAGNEGHGSDMESTSGTVRAGSGEPATSTAPLVYHRVVPESFEGRYGYFWRLTAIVGITLGLLIAILVGLAIFGELSELLR